MGTIGDYRQTDPRWSGIKYAGDKVYSSGCGATACADVLYALNPTITPAQTAVWAESNGLTANGQGTYWGGIPTICKHFGLNAQQLNGSNVYGQLNTVVEKTWKDKMKTGKYYGILLMGKSIFTSGGHYIAVNSWDGTYVDVRDPYTASYSRKHNWSAFEGKVKIYYLVDKPATYKAKSNTYLYSKACTGSYICKVPKGTSITLISDCGKGMSKVNVNNKVGYIYNSQISTALSKCKKYEIINKTYVYGSINKSNKISVDKKAKTKALDVGRRGTLYSYGNIWARIEYKGKTKWILKKRIKVM